MTRLCIPAFYRNAKLSLVAAAILLSLTGVAAAQERVAPASYRQFWLWGGVAAPVFLQHAETVYILQGLVAHRGGELRLQRQGVAPAALPGQQVYLDFRIETLDWNERLLAGMLNLARAWEHAGSRVAGVQLDFDSRTPDLADYAAYLRRVRHALPQPYRLSITGLLDWSTGGAPEAMEALAGTVDEIVFQTYRGRQTIANYRDYLAGVARLHVPFKIGLVEDGLWDREAEARLAASTYYRGAVVFLTGRR